MIESPTRQDRPRIAVAHDWLCGYRGGEAVLERLCALVQRHYTPAALLVMFDDRRPLSPTVDAWRTRGLIHASSINRWPASLRLRRWLLPFYPRAIANLSRRLAALHAEEPIDLVISSSSAAIKGLKPPPGVPHLCYCHSPARYIWSQRAEYAGRGILGALRSAGLLLITPFYKAWDRRTAAHVTDFLANSAYTSRRIKKCFCRDAAIIAPPVRTDYFTPDPAVPRKNFCLVVSALEPYKRIDLAIAAVELAQLSRAGPPNLAIAGAGSQLAALKRLAGENVRFLGRVSDEQLRTLYRSAYVLIFPQVEDFGIIAAEALACGLPIVARREGGALDIITDGQTGALFDEPTPAAIAQALSRLPTDCSPVCRAAAERFSETRFDREMLAAINRALGDEPRTK